MSKINDLKTNKNALIVHLPTCLFHIFPLYCSLSMIQQWCNVRVGRKVLCDGDLVISMEEGVGGGGGLERYTVGLLE